MTAVVVTVRRATPDDAAAFVRIMGDPAVYPGLMQLPYTNEAPCRTLVAGLDGTVVGTAGLHPVPPRIEPAVDVA